MYYIHTLSLRRYYIKSRKRNLHDDGKRVYSTIFIFFFYVCVCLPIWWCGVRRPPTKYALRRMKRKKSFKENCNAPYIQLLERRRTWIYTFSCEMSYVFRYFIYSYYMYIIVSIIVGILHTQDDIRFYFLELVFVYKIL